MTAEQRVFMVMSEMRSQRSRVQRDHGRRFLFNIGGTIDRGAEGAEVERRRRENRGAEGVRRGEGVFPLVWVWPPENISIADLKMMSFDAFCVVFLKFRSIYQHLGIRLYY